MQSAIASIIAHPHALSNSANGNQGSATAAAAPRLFSTTAQQVATLSEVVEQQLYSLVRHHRCCGKATDPDMYIMRKPKAMTCELPVLKALADVTNPLRRRLIYLSMSAACLQIEGSPKPLLPLIC